ncbi:G-type lectin S-receptor-like serine/threonine-protein kinase At1g11330 isoform X1 [Typha angustifolia]|uniref:G-type lectin S-receptor-like serine/threonine-protein kinase At1g11330 isoform X1 n=1 Tax=Typha angustifolia TaxID=59011 RepID=UPI003C2B24F1
MSFYYITSSLFSPILIASLCFASLLCHATDTLTPGQSLRDGDKLISADGVVELGFFSRPGKSTRRYVGIWYYNFSADPVIWVANRDAPIADSSGRLAIGTDGNLVVFDKNKNILWSSNTKVESNDSTVQLLDTGNLVLNNSGTVAWQSFDHPTDTYLPGMKVGLDLRTNVNQLLTSWKSEDDPGVGNFSMGIDPKGSTQIFIWNGKKPWWRSGWWNGQMFVGIQGMVPTCIYGFRLDYYIQDDQEQKLYFYFTGYDSLHHYVLTSDGIQKYLELSQDTKSWNTRFAQPTTPCQHYNECGNYGSCSDENSPTCTCLKGYVPANHSEWNSGNWNSGCVKRTLFQCERNTSASSNGIVKDDGFWKMEQVKLPDLSDWYSEVLAEDGCRVTCLSNCSCKAYAYTTGIGCLIWGQDLVDIHIFSSGGEDMYLRLAGSELVLADEKKKKHGAEIVTLVLVFSVAFLFGCIYLCWKCKKRRKGRIAPGLQSTMDKGRGIVQKEFSDVSNVKDDAKDGEWGELPLLNFDSLVAATDNFTHMNFLGEGGFGPVYKGMLPEGKEVAVKRLSRNSGQGMEEFKNEVILIAKLQHRNLVRLLGCCIQGKEKILIYEYMPNKSLNAFLFDPTKKEQLDWKTRYSIIEGIARGLLYLHRDSRLRVIHRDLKVSNILLDEEMNPKISDFGLARIFGSDDNETNTKRVVGTYGYMSPEYAMQGVFSVKSDVYSFGVLLLEIVSGKKNSTYSNQELSLNLLGQAWKLWNEDNVLEFVDPSIRNSCSLKEVSRCINVGLLCVQDRANDRPTMSSVIIMLESGTLENASPRQPTFVVEMIPGHTDSSSADVRAISVNASITMLTGR